MASAFNTTGRGRYGGLPGYDPYQKIGLSPMRHDPLAGERLQAQSAYDVAEQNRLGATDVANQAAWECPTATPIPCWTGWASTAARWAASWAAPAPTAR